MVVERLAATCSSVHRADKIWLWTSKLETVLAAMEKQFGTNKSINEVGAACHPQMKQLRPAIQPIIDSLGDDLMRTAELKMAQIFAPTPGETSQAQ